jgi:Uma2 family endonuclease
MAEAGIFPPDARVELIEGELLTMAPIGHPHAWAVAALNDSITRSPLGQLTFVWPQLPVVLSEFSEPQPDILLVRRPESRYRVAKPRPDDVVLLIEVSDSTLPFDRQRKMPLYARHGIFECWILNVPDRRLEVYRRPQTGVYLEVRELQPGTPVRLAAFPDIEFDWSIALT